MQKFRSYIPQRHPGESRDPGCKPAFKIMFKAWIPVFAGMTLWVALLTYPFPSFALESKSPLISSPNFTTTPVEAPVPKAKAPDPTFEWGKVYVSPNPARNGAAPRFHVEVGVADIVRIRIYDLRGRLVFKAKTEGSPLPIDDGQGLQLAYEWSWEDSIPSGIYYYVVKAEKSGKKVLSKAGKFSVVR